MVSLLDLTTPAGRPRCHRVSQQSSRIRELPLFLPLLRHNEISFSVSRSTNLIAMLSYVNLLVPFIHIKWTQVELFRCSARCTCSAKQQLKNVRLVEAHHCRAKSKTLRSSRKTLHTQSQKKTTVSTKHLNFTASPSYFITQLQPLSICHWQHYYNLCHVEGPSYSGFIERLSIQKQTKKKFLT